MSKGFVRFTYKGDKWSASTYRKKFFGWMVAFTNHDAGICPCLHLHVMAESLSPEVCIRALEKHEEFIKQRGY